MKNIALPYAVMHHEDPIISIVFKGKAQLGFFEMKEILRKAEKLSQGKPYFTLCYVPDIMNVTPMGRKIALECIETPLNKATAVIVKKEIVTRTANFFYKMKRSDVHIRVFTDGEEARAWLIKLENGQYKNAG